jgi:hypothetical protein
MRVITVAFRGLVGGAAFLGFATAYIAGLNLRGAAVLWGFGLLLVVAIDALKALPWWKCLAGDAEDGVATPSNPLRPHGASRPAASREASA